MLDIDQAWSAGYGWLWDKISPLLHRLGFSAYMEYAYEWIDFALKGAAEVLIVALVCIVLERLWPLETISNPRGVRTDRWYTLITRLGLTPLLFFAAFNDLQSYFTLEVLETGFVPQTLEQMFPWLQERRWVVLVLYLLLLDLSVYWRHRLQHQFEWWWALHSLHHDQPQMTFWTDDRNHILDNIISGAWEAGVALLIGVAPSEYPVVLLFQRLVEAGSHANLRLHFGWLGERLLVSPRFHRAHHAIRYEPGRPKGGCNFSTIFPIWDILFRTGDFRRDRFAPTGVEGRESVAAIGDGLWMQQWIGFKRFGRALVGKPID